MRGWAPTGRALYSLYGWRRPRISSSLSRKRGAHSMASETDANREEEGAGFESGLLDWLVLRDFGVAQTQRTFFLIPSVPIDGFRISSPNQGG